MHRPKSPHILLTLLFTVTALAQTPSTPDAPPQTAVTRNAPLNPTLPTLFLVGDSTARNQLDLGWGDHLAHYFDLTRINVANRAHAGRSGRTFIDEGSWDNLLSEMKPGDFVLIQMGHNDGGGNLQSVRNDPQISRQHQGIGEETVDIPLITPITTGPLAGKPIETVHTYGWYLRKYIADTRARQSTPILLTVTIRNIWKNDADGKPHIERDMGFRDYEFQVGSAERVPVVDMATVAADRLEALGPEKTAALYPIDHTHTSAEGAERNAESVAIALRNAHSPLVPYLKPDSPPEP